MISADERSFKAIGDIDSIGIVQKGVVREDRVEQHAMTIVLVVFDPIIGAWCEVQAPATVLESVTRHSKIAEHPGLTNYAPVDIHELIVENGNIMMLCTLQGDADTASGGGVQPVSNESVVLDDGIETEDRDPT
jgi:hypothetical protein